jgi:Zinc carboxypeptidase
MNFRQLFKTCCVALISSSLYAQQIDGAYNQKIKEHTTDPRFLPSSVLDLVADPKIPSPLKQFGQIIGAPGIQHRTADIYGYFKQLAQTSPNIINEQIGTTEEGRPIQMAIIANAATLKRLDHYKKQLALLADPRKMNPADLQKILGDSKVVYYLNGGMHATETGSPEMLMELAYRLITGQSDEIKAIRDNLIVLINPVSEPDGWDKMVDWYYRYTKKKTNFDDGMPASPPYWGKYTYHDNNRDGLQVSQAITKSIFKTYLDWHPTVMLDLHESVPLLYISTGTGPYNEHIDPIAVGEWQIMADHDMTSLAAQGLPGAFNWAFYDGWYPGYGIWVANNHNSVGRFYETYGNAGANTFMRDLSNAKFAGDAVTSREWYRPYPATEKVYWSFRNNINYMQAGVLASLGYAATNDKVLLKNFYQKSLNNITKGSNLTPKAFVIGKNQRDPAMAAYLVNQLQAQGIEVHKAESGKNQGDYVVLLNQPYRNLAVSLLTKQNYPKEAKFPPYDDIAWTLQYLYGVDVTQQDTLKYDLKDLKMLTAAAKYEGKAEGEGNNYVLHYKAQNTVLPAAYWLKSQNKDAKTIVLDAKTPLDGSKDTVAIGSVLFKGMTSEQAKNMAAKFGFDLTPVKNAPTVKQHEVSLPRVAIYHTWYNTQDEGWSRYTFEQRGIPYTSIHKDQLKKGNLRSQFDVILIPRVRGNGSDFVHEIDTKYGPMPYTKTNEYASHGAPDATDDMTGGPGFGGIEELKKFVEAGGVVISLDNSSSILSDLGIVRELKRYEAPTLFHPGSIVQVKVRNRNHPIMYGYPETFHIFKGMGALLQTEKRDRSMMLLQYGTKPLKDEEEYKGLIMGMPDKKETKAEPKTAKPEPPYVLSGMVRNEQTIVGHGGIFNVPVGAGQVVAFTFDPLHRYLNHHDAPLLWNAILNWNVLR